MTALRDLYNHTHAVMLRPNYTFIATCVYIENTKLIYFPILCLFSIEFNCFLLRLKMDYVNCTLWAFEDAVCLFNESLNEHRVLTQDENQLHWLTFSELISDFGYIWAAFIYSYVNTPKAE